MERTWAFIQQGGPVMVPLLMCSVLALAVTLERLWALRRSRVLPEPLIDLAAAFGPGDDPNRWEGVLARHVGPFAALLSVLVTSPPAEREVAVERTQAAGRRAVRELDRGLAVLEIVAGISPLLGLFGTVLGMFSTFQVIARQGLGDPGALSGGISVALVTTIVGLGIAIPTLVAEGYFNRRVEDLVLEIEEHAAALIHRLYPDGRRLATSASGRTGSDEGGPGTD